MPDKKSPSLADLVVKPHHTAVSVADFEVARDFFVEVLGMTLIDEMDHRHETNLDTVVGLPDCDMRWGILEQAGYRIELFHYYEPEGRAVPIRQCDHGLTHLCWQVSDVDAAYRRMREAGYETLSEPLDLRGGVARPVYVKGPEGIIVELLELRA